MMSNLQNVNFVGSRQTIEPFDQTGQPTSPGITRYTQIAWANTTCIGCGLTVDRTRGSFSAVSLISFVLSWKLHSNVTFKLLVCFYGPAGNINGDNMYDAFNITTETAGPCPQSGFNRLGNGTFAGLCAPP